MRRALGVDQHLPGELGLQLLQLAQSRLILLGCDVAREQAATRGHEKIEVEHASAELAGQLCDLDDLTDVVLADRRLDDESGLYYYRARYYDPTEGRFLEADPIGYGDGMNLYEFVKSQPILNLDPFFKIFCFFGIYAFNLFQYFTQSNQMY